MPNQTNNATRRKIRSSYFTTTISIAMVLFLLGIIGLLILNASRVSAYVKENLSVTVTLSPDAREAEIKQIEKQLLAAPQVKSVVSVDKDQAAKQWEEALGEDFVSTLDYNPLLPTMEVKLFAQYADAGGMQSVADMLQSYKTVRDVHFEQDMVNLIHNNIRRISIVLLCFSAMMLLVALTLINNTVRLMVYSKRFLIRTMQLVGATRSFIRRPFVASSIAQGIAGALIANAMLAAVIFFSSRELPDVVSFSHTYIVVSLFAMVFVAGILMTLFSTILSVNKYLSVRTADLYV